MRDHENPPDAELIERAKRGDEKAFTQLVRRYEQTVYNFALKMCRDREKAAETLQDTFINVFRKLHQFDGRSKFSTWLYSIVTNNCLMKNRRRKLDAELLSLEADFPERENPDRHITSWDDSPIEGVIKRELRERLDGAIQKLPVEYRVVFMLRDVEGEKAEDVAKILHLSVPAVKSRLRRARIFLRNQLDPYMRK